MSRFKRFVSGTGICLIALGCLSGLWYQRHYVLPPEPPRRVVSSSPKGVDTFQEAVLLCVVRHNGTVLTLTPWPQMTLAERQALLAANEASIAKTRQALTQESLQPPLSWPQNRSLTGAQFYRQNQLLVFAAQVYADSGNYPEAMTCALDSIELGVKLRRGGALSGVYCGSSCENLGKAMAWALVDRVDAKTARAAVARLNQIEAARWPLVRALDEERWLNYQSIQATFAGGPLPSWKAIERLVDYHNRPVAQEITKSSPLSHSVSPQISPRQKTLEHLWLQTQIVYYGPRTVLESTDKWLKLLQQRTAAPWDYARYQRDRLSPTLPGNPFSQIAESSPAGEYVLFMDLRNQLPPPEHLSRSARRVPGNRALPGGSCTVQRPVFTHPGPAGLQNRRQAHDSLERGARRCGQQCQSSGRSLDRRTGRYRGNNPYLVSWRAWKPLA
ncbi:MAG: hypothetical protein QM758_07210 [Armatimonas sp.]